MTADAFATKAGGYDGSDERVANVQRIAEAILAHAPLRPDMHVMDFGSGTGLLAERVAPFVRHLTALDVSPAMNAQLAAKRAQFRCGLDILEADLADVDRGLRLDGIVSSMALHHVPDVGALLAHMRVRLVDEGFIALVDLDAEDGRFHDDMAGVHHRGFDRASIGRLAEAAGFRDVRLLDGPLLQRPQGRYPTFLLLARR